MVMIKGKLETKYYKIERLVKWDRVDEVNTMLMSGISPKAVSKWCCEHGFSISDGKMYDYKRILQDALAKQVTVERLLGIGKPRRNPIVMQAMGVSEAKNLVKSEMEVLDAIIQKGFSLMQISPDVKVADAMKAIELKNKLTKGAHGGMTNFGLDTLRELEKAKFEVMIDIVMEYLPEDKIEVLQDRLALAERTFYEENAPELLEEYDGVVQSELEDLNEITSNDEENIIVED